MCLSILRQRSHRFAHYFGPRSRGALAGPPGAAGLDCHGRLGPVYRASDRPRTRRWPRTATVTVPHKPSESCRPAGGPGPRGPQVA